MVARMAMRRRSIVKASLTLGVHRQDSPRRRGAATVVAVAVPASGGSMEQNRIGRREAIALLGAAGAAFAAGCGSPSEPSSTGGATSGNGTANAACAVTPTETIG